MEGLGSIMRGKERTKAMGKMREGWRVRGRFGCFISSSNAREAHEEAKSPPFINTDGIMVAVPEMPLCRCGNPSAVSADSLLLS
jgi:hypothetical protein